jgi:integrase
MPQPLTHAFISKPLLPKRYFDTTRGLHLFVKDSGRKYWIFRYTLRGKRHDYSLGPYPDISLAEARDAATRARLAVRKGESPLPEETTAAAIAPRFAEFAEEFISMNEAQWTNPKHVAQWRRTLCEYAFPVIGDLEVNVITTEHLLRILAPLWTVKTETASRLRGRIERVLGAATARGLRSGVNPAQWRGHLEHTLPPPKRIKKVEHYAALPYRRIHEVIDALRKKDCVSALALEFAILTAARTGEIRFAQWSEIQDDLWIIPATRMKAKKEHRVPLSTRCQDILNIARRLPGSTSFIFHRNGRPLSNVAMSKLLEGIARGYTVHGFRSSFRDWAAEETEHSRDVAEMALAHAIESAVEASYRRGDLINRRRRLMEDWSRYCDTVAAHNILSIEKKCA